MKVYFDEDTGVIVINNQNRLFAGGSMIASKDGDKVQIKYKNSNIIEVKTDYSNYIDANDNSAGEDADEVVDYLNSEFSKGAISGNDAFSLLSATVTITDNRIKTGDKIVVSPQVNALNDVVYVSNVANGSFVVSRKIIDGLGSLTSGLTFNWIRL